MKRVNRSEEKEQERRTEPQNGAFAIESHGGNAMGVVGVDGLQKLSSQHVVLEDLALLSSQEEQLTRDGGRDTPNIGALVCEGHQGDVREAKVPEQRLVVLGGNEAVEAFPQGGDLVDTGCVAKEGLYALGSPSIPHAHCVVSSSREEELVHGQPLEAVELVRVSAELSDLKRG